jgi:glycopeptide antibiotics resistance protein
MNNKLKKILPVLFWCYLIFIFVFVIVKFDGSIASLQMRIEDTREWAEQGFWRTNFVPFHSIGSEVRFGEWLPLLANLCLLIPYGFLLPLTYGKVNRGLKVFVCTLLLTVFFEVFQLVTFTGSFDVDDILLNVLGGMIGYVIYRLLNKRFQL